MHVIDKMHNNHKLLRMQVIRFQLSVAATFNFDDYEQLTEKRIIKSKKNQCSSNACTFTLCVSNELKK